MHDTGQLGETIARGGRETIEMMLADVFARTPDGALPPDEAARTYLDLLIGDRQVRHIICADPAPDDAEIAARAARAKRLTLRLERPDVA